MKKLIFTLCAAFLAVGANALSLTNPLYMPEEGQFLIEGSAAFKDDSSGNDDTYLYRATVSYNTSDSLQLGGYIGYAYLSKATPKRDDFTNPGAFAYYRLFDTIVKIDVGGDAEFDVFDNVAQGGVADGANKYGAILRAGADLKALSFGATGKVSWWDLDSSMGYVHGDMVNTEANAFIIFDVMDMFGLGAEAGYNTYNVRRDDKWHSRYITARMDINPLPSRLGVLVYATAEDNEFNPHTQYSGGIKARLAI